MGAYPFIGSTLILVAFAGMQLIAIGAQLTTSPTFGHAAQLTGMKMLGACLVITGVLGAHMFDKATTIVTEYSSFEVVSYLAIFHTIVGGITRAFTK